MRKTLAESKNYTLWYHVGTKVLHHQIHGPLEPGELTTLLSTGLDFMKRHKVQKWISDDRGRSTVPPDEADWSQQVFAPAAVQAGWKHWAILNPEGAVSKLQMKRFVSYNAEYGLTVEFFDDPDAAHDWIKKAA